MKSEPNMKYSDK